jgi:lysophospholipase L1-like esterase
MVRWAAARSPGTRQKRLGIKIGILSGASSVTKTRVVLAARLVLGFLTVATCLLSAEQMACAQSRVACIGDSITYGALLPDRETQCYPAVLGSLLGEDYEVRNYGVPGAAMLRHSTRPYRTTDAFAESSSWNPDIVVIMLGTNDSIPINWQYRDEFEGDYLDMIAHYAGLPSMPLVYLCTPCPVYGPNMFGISPEVVRDEIVPLVWQIGAESYSPIIDVFTALSDLPDYFFDDHVHPNPDGAALIAATVWEVLTQ